MGIFEKKFSGPKKEDVKEIDEVQELETPAVPPEDAINTVDDDLIDPEDPVTTFIDPEKMRKLAELKDEDKPINE